jgi:UDP-N-acetylmuramoylalanine--D-glutamate ligase
MDLTGKKVLVVGLARTGVALCHFLASAGAKVAVTDQAPASELKEARREIAGLGVMEELGVPQPHWPGYDLIVLSPGVPPQSPWLAAAREAGIPVWGELELAAPFWRRPVLAVSGTNGKTTTTTLLGEMLQASGLKPLVGGNIGTPAISLLSRQAEADCLVLEVSSFQLDTAPHFHPQAAALLNVTPDHLDRYESFAAYVASKASLFRCQETPDLKVLNADDAAVAAQGREGKGRVYYFSAARAQKEGAWVAHGAIQVRLFTGWQVKFPLKDILLPGRHNLENIMAALLLALDAGAQVAACRQVLARFSGLPHRLQWVTTIDGVEFYDDSKGTNVGAVACSLRYFDKPVVLIAGGRDKDSDFTLLTSLIQERVKALVLLGETQERLARAWNGAAPAYLAANLAEAVAAAKDLARPGEVVLLSPACASFDMFRDYVHRGETFQRLVRGLEHGE